MNNQICILMLNAFHGGAGGLLMVYHALMQHLIIKMETWRGF